MEKIEREKNKEDKLNSQNERRDPCERVLLSIESYST